VAVTAPIDLWLCSDPCTAKTPCLWDLESDPFERNEVSGANPAVVRSLLARLQVLQASFGTDAAESGTLVDNGEFCAVLNATEVEGFGVFVAPWMPDPRP
jgi:hypothetical protein